MQKGDNSDSKPRGVSGDSGMLGVEGHLGVDWEASVDSSDECTEENTSPSVITHIVSKSTSVG